MMRSLYSAVAGLKTHQTKMDVIGNNIANVNTVAFKSSSVTFSTIMYQTLSNASGANAAAGTGGVNAKQIGLGVAMASTAASITKAGAAETTGNAFDLKITDNSSSSFFVVYNGSENVFTKAGSFYVDGTGNLCMTSTGYTVMGWQVDPEGNIKKDTVSALKVMSAENQTSSPETTTKAMCTGVIDNNSATMSSDSGYSMNLTIYDSLGYPYTARFAVKAEDISNGEYTVNLTDILNADGKSILNSDIALSDLFSAGGAEVQGSGIDITDNYNFNTGKSKSNIQDVINAVAGEAADDASDDTTGRLYTYYLDAEDVNEQLDLTGNGALPKGYRIRLQSPYNDVNQAMAALTDGSSGYNTFYITKGNDSVVGRGTFSDTEGWVIEEGTMKEGAFELAETQTDKYSITKTVTVKDFLALGQKVTATNGTSTYTGYCFTGSALTKLKEELGLKDTDKGFDTDDNEYYYFPDFPSDGTLSLTSNENIKITSASSYLPVGGSNTTVDLETEDYADDEGVPSYTYGIEKILGDYSYAQVNGATLGKQTEADPLFTEELPADALIKYSMFNASWRIETPRADGYALKFDTTTGTLSYVGSAGNKNGSLDLSSLVAAGYDAFDNVEIDFSNLLNYNNNGSSTAALSGGDADGDGKGKKLGTLTGLSVDTAGKIYGSYDNGNTVLLGQIAVAQFANAAGLEATGDNCYKTTLNSGDFDGIGVEISADGSSISTGELEMSNVDLASEFTSMITTQRGFQANSRVITTSDSMLEELISLKR